jgi:hypothetical protein
MRKTLRCIVWGLPVACALELARPGQAQMPYPERWGNASATRVGAAALSTVDAATAHLEEMQVELAWLSDPMTFPFGLVAHAGPRGMEVHGYVPTNSIRQRVLQLAQQHSTLPPVDMLKLHPAMALRFAGSVSPAAAEQDAYDLLSEALGTSAANLWVMISYDGRVTVCGSVGSLDDQLKACKCLRRLKQCTSVVNQLSLASEAQAVAPNAVQREATHSAPVVQQPDAPPAAPIVSQPEAALAAPLMSHETEPVWRPSPAAAPIVEQSQEPQSAPAPVPLPMTRQHDEPESTSATPLPPVSHQVPVPEAKPLVPPLIQQSQEPEASPASVPAPARPAPQEPANLPESKALNPTARGELPKESPAAPIAWHPPAGSEVGPAKTEPVPPAVVSQPVASKPEPKAASLTGAPSLDGPQPVLPAPFKPYQLPEPTTPKPTANSELAAPTSWHPPAARSEAEPVKTEGPSPDGPQPVLPAPFKPYQ